ncbi:hypothetical protein G9E11_11845 [Arthrobacter sp. IA7]|uniref:hypothetical protein n=1 Tax=Arthrobacter ipis TaxID=2716202 RepID=UPI0016890E9A|nr:hypothetical protein [Arthrobacter ipis]MBD1542929.1 hypothetical protein [Arthrobacter ipis]
MTILQLSTSAGQQRKTPPTTAPRLDRPATPVGVSSDGLLQFQLQRLIGKILADPDLDPDVYMSLTGHLAANPGHPEMALLAHLHDVQDPDDLPPYKVYR